MLRPEGHDRHVAYQDRVRGAVHRRYRVPRQTTKNSMAASATWPNAHAQAQQVEAGRGGRLRPARQTVASLAAYAILSGGVACGMACMVNKRHVPGRRSFPSHRPPGLRPTLIPATPDPVFNPKITWLIAEAVTGTRCSVNLHESSWRQDCYLHARDRGSSSSGMCLFPRCSPGVQSAGRRAV